MKIIVILKSMIIRRILRN